MSSQDEDDRSRAELEEEERRGSWWSPLGEFDDRARAGVSKMQDVVQGSLRQLQDWLAADEGPIGAAVSQLRDQAVEVQRRLERQLKALEGVRDGLERRLTKQANAFRKQQQQALKQLQKAVNDVRKAAEQVRRTRTSPAKKSTARGSTTKKSTAKTSPAKRSTTKKSTAKRSTAKSR